MNFLELESFLKEYLQTDLFKDYCPNGLQVQGTKDIKKIITGVTACQLLIDEAIKQKADAILVHHGYFWKGESYPITGIKYNRIAKLIKNDIHLFAYHLPLDANQNIGNNVSLAKLLGLGFEKSIPSNKSTDISIMTNNNTKYKTLEDFCLLIEEKLNRKPLAIKGNNNDIKKVAICTGGAQDYIEMAYNCGADTFISGEISERTTHIARELGINYISAGHHATEKYGIQELGKIISEKFNLEHIFIDINNPA